MGGYLSKGRVVVVDVGGGNQLRIILQHRIDCLCMCVVWGWGGRVLLEGGGVGGGEEVLIS